MGEKVLKIKIVIGGGDNGRDGRRMSVKKSADTVCCYVLVWYDTKSREYFD